MYFTIVEQTTFTSCYVFYVEEEMVTMNAGLWSRKETTRPTGLVNVLLSAGHSSVALCAKTHCPVGKETKTSRGDNVEEVDNDRARRER